MNVGKFYKNVNRSEVFLAEVVHISNFDGFNIRKSNNGSLNVGFTDRNPIELFERNQVIPVWEEVEVEDQELHYELTSKGIKYAIDLNHKHSQKVMRLFEENGLVEGRLLVGRFYRIRNTKKVALITSKDQDSYDLYKSYVIQEDGSVSTFEDRNNFGKETAKKDLVKLADCKGNEVVPRWTK